MSENGAKNSSFNKQRETLKIIYRKIFTKITLNKQYMVFVERYWILRTMLVFLWILLVQVDRWALNWSVKPRKSLYLINNKRFILTVTYLKLSIFLIMVTMCALYQLAEFSMDKTKLLNSSNWYFFHQLKLLRHTCR